MLENARISLDGQHMACVIIKVDGKTEVRSKCGIEGIRSQGINDATLANTVLQPEYFVHLVRRFLQIQPPKDIIQSL
jgi:hypothetical protein